jgi:hypothetical protein
MTTRALELAKDLLQVMADDTEDEHDLMLRGTAVAEAVIDEHKIAPKRYGVTYFAGNHPQGITKEDAASCGRGVADAVAVLAFEVDKSRPLMGNTLTVQMRTVMPDGRGMSANDLWHGWMALAEFLMQVPEGDLTPGQRAMCRAVHNAKMEAHSEMVREKGGGDA